MITIEQANQLNKQQREEFNRRPKPPAAPPVMQLPKDNNGKVDK